MRKPERLISNHSHHSPSNIININNTNSSDKIFTICILTYGNYPELAKRSIGSVIDNLDRSKYELRVACNEVCKETLTYVNKLFSEGKIDRKYINKKNINKCPAMRQMFKDINTEWIWWFDDDSYVTSNEALERRIERIENDNKDAYGHVFSFRSLENLIGEYIRKESWYKGYRIPCGRTEYDKNSTEDKMFFMTGGMWIIKSNVIKLLDYPPKEMVKAYDDILLGVYLRQNNFSFSNYTDDYTVISEADRRGDGECKETIDRQWK